MSIEFIADSPNPKALIRPFKQRFWELAGHARHLKIAVGYIDVASLAEINDYLVRNPGLRLDLLVGMQYFDGFTHPQLNALKKLASRLEEEDSGNIRISTRVRYHGKLYSFDSENGSSAIYVGSGNLSAISQSYSSTYEAGVLVEDKDDEIANYMQSVLFPLATPFEYLDIEATNRNLTSPLEKMDQVEKLEERVPTELKHHLSPTHKFSIPVKPTPKSNINAFFGKGRQSVATGRTLARPWYEVELIPGFRITRNKNYPQNKAEFDVITDNGYRFTCNVSGSEGNKNLRSSGSLSVLGAYLKGHLEALGLLNPGEPVTQEILDDYGRDHVDLMYFDQTKRWVLDFRPEREYE